MEKKGTDLYFLAGGLQTAPRVPYGVCGPGGSITMPLAMSQGVDTPLRVDLTVSGGPRRYSTMDLEEEDSVINFGTHNLTVRTVHSATHPASLLRELAGPPDPWCCGEDPFFSMDLASPLVSDLSETSYRL